MSAGSFPIGEREETFPPRTTRRVTLKLVA